MITQPMVYGGITKLTNCMFYTLSVFSIMKQSENLDAVQDDGAIIVHSGVYDEQLSISKPVAIIGAGTPQCY